MKFTTTVERLKDLAMPLAGTVAAHGPGEKSYYSLFLFEFSDAGLRLVAGNGMQQQDRHTKLSKVDQPKNFTLLARSVMNICSNLPDKAEITFEMSGNKCMVNGERVDYKLDTSMPADDFPKMEPIAPENALKIKEKDLKFLFDQTLFSSGKNDARAYLNSVMLAADGKSVLCVATDGHRLAKCEMKNNTLGTDKPLSAILPNRFVEEVTRLLGGPDGEDGEGDGGRSGNDEVELALGEKHIDIKNERFCLSSNLLEAQYPDWQSVIPKGHKWRLEIDREGLLQNIQRVMAIADNVEDAVSMSFKDNTLFFATSNRLTTEEARAGVDAKSEGDAFELSFNAKYLVDAVTAADADTIVAEMTDPATAAKLYGKNAKESLFLIMPVKL